MALRPLAPNGFSSFAVAGALMALAMVPMALTSVDPPAQPLNMRPRLVWLVRMAPISCFSVLAAGGSSLSLAHGEGGGRTEAGGTPIP